MTVTPGLPVPAILKDLLTHPRLSEFDVSSVSRVAAAGAATPSDVPGLLQDKLGIVTRSAGYGMTETASVCATMSGPVFDLKPLACGVLSPIIELRVASADGAVSVDRGRRDSAARCHRHTRLLAARRYDPRGVYR